MRTQEEAFAIFREAVEECRKVLDGKLRDAYLYGSYARGDFHEWSDIDILLTVDMTPEELTKYRHLISIVNNDLSLKYDVTVSTTAKPLEQFNRYADVMPYYRNVLREGIRYGA